MCSKLLSQIKREKKSMAKKLYKKGAMALSQILILIVGTVAFTYIIGSSIGFVSADNVSCSGSGQIGTTNTFCYGGVIYTVSDSMHASRGDGRSYINQGGSWYWVSPNGNILLGPGTGDTQSTFAAGASAAKSGLNNPAPSSQSTGNLGDLCAGVGDNPTCQSGYCDGTACASRPSALSLPIGIQCIGPDDCQSGFCDTSLTNPVCAVAPAGSKAPPVTNAAPANALPASGFSSMQACLAAGLSQDICNGIFNIAKGSGTPPAANSQTQTGSGTVTAGGGCNSAAEGSDCASGLQCTGTGDVYTCQAEQTPTDWKAIGDKIGSFITTLALNAGIAIGVYYVVGFIKSNLLGVKPGDQWNYAATAFQFMAAGAVFGALEVPQLMTTLGISAASAGFWGSAAGGGIIGIAIAVAVFLLFYKTTKLNAVIVSCVPWQAPNGGNDCGKCGQNGLSCTSYQCTSLGQACKLENSQAGQGKSICVWVDPHDINPPVMTFLSSALPSGYTYTPLNAQVPGDTGVLIQSPTGDIPPYTALTFGISTDKASKCKIDLVRQDSYENMSFTMFGGIDGTEGLTAYNHTVSIPVFQPSSSISVQKSGQVDIYIRCQNANGYSDIPVFDVQFIVDTTPDQTPPQIIGTSILNGAPVPSGTTSTNVGVYVNEPVSSCKWSHNNYDYSNMENNMSCGNVMNTQGTYSGTVTCNANLNGLKSAVENDFYFACNDTSGNVDTQAYKYVLMGTQPLGISMVTPSNGTLIKDSTQSVKVTLGVQTNAGQNQGQAICYYSPTGNGADYLMFSTTNSYQSAQDLYLPSGAYTYYIKCVDLGGNAAYSSINFNVQTDTQAPNVVRATHDGANLDIQTDEKATCVYDIVDCTYPFENGNAMSTTDGLTHATSWVAGRTYYIKCQDSFGNQPDPNSCSIVLSPSQV